MIVDKKQLLMFFIQGMRLNKINSIPILFDMVKKKLREKYDECNCTKQQCERWLLCNFKRAFVVSTHAVIWPPPSAYLPLISGCSNN